MFLHANGFPPAAYRRCLSAFARSAGASVHALALRPLTMPETVPGIDFDWMTMAADVECWLDAAGLQPMIIAGHSLGAVVAIALASRRADAYARIVLFDPTVFEREVLERWRAALPEAPARAELVRRTLSRPTRFPDIAAAFAFHRARRPYARMDDEALEAYVKAAFLPASDGGVRLAYPPRWEARIYETVPDVWDTFARSRAPVDIHRGSLSDVLTASAAEKLTAARPNVTVHTWPELGHLLPLEAPEAVGGRAGVVIGN